MMAISDQMTEHAYDKATLVKVRAAYWVKENNKNYREMTLLGVYQLSCGPIPMKNGGNFPEGLPELPIRSKNQYLSRKTTIIRFKLLKQK